MPPTSLPSPRLRCPSCDGSDLADRGAIPPGPRFAGRILDEPLPGGRLYACRTCHLSFRHPQLSKTKLEALYQEAEPGHWAYAPEHRRDWAIAARYLETHYGSGAVLDVGCFDGAFLERLGAGWDRYGIEINEAARRRAAARGVAVVAQEAEALCRLDQCFDAIVAFDLVEHVRDPRALLGQMAQRLTSGGAILVGTGNTQAPAWRLMGSRYWYCAIPEHLAFISEAWCRTSAAALGLNLVFVERYSHARSRRPLQIASETGKNLVYRFAPGLFGALRARGWGGLDVSKADALKSYPPAWMTARDHLIAVFQKP